MRITVAQSLVSRWEGVIVEHKGAIFGEETDQTATAWPTIEPQSHRVSLWGVFAFHKPANDPNGINVVRDVVHLVHRYDQFN